jgi:hypothetical protein
MFRRISLANFKSFRKMDFDLTEGNIGKANNLALIYGTNGSGKSNLMDAVAFLKMSSHTIDGDSPDVSELAASVRAKGSEGPMALEFRFTNGSEDGEYLMEFDPDGNLIREKLDYTINKNAGNIFEISAENGNPTAIYSRQLYKNGPSKGIMDHGIVKYWGKHTFLSILRNEMSGLNPEYLDQLLGTGIMDVLDYLDGILICRPGLESLGGTVIDRMPDAGVIDSSETDSLSAFAEAAEAFLSSAFGDVSGVRYETEDDGQTTAYMMMVTRKDANGEIEVPIEDECLGVREAVRILPALLKGAGGGVALVDDIEYGFHEVILDNIFCIGLNGMEGQLIASTHDTIMLESANPRSVFMAKNGKIIPITEIERTQRNHNNRNRYFKGVFGAIPKSEPANLADLASKYRQSRTRTSYNEWAITQQRNDK